jgi:hypothetical protein
MFKIYKDVFFWSFVLLWLIISAGTYIITGDTFISVCIINPIMILIFAIISRIRLNNDRFYNWLETPLKEKK